MVDIPDNVLKILCEMLGDHGQRRRRIEDRVVELQDSVVAGFGPAAHAEVRHDAVEKRPIDLTERVERLESRP